VAWDATLRPLGRGVAVRRVVQKARSPVLPADGEERWSSMRTAVHTFWAARVEQAGLVAPWRYLYINIAGDCGSPSWVWLRGGNRIDEFLLEWDRGEQVGRQRAHARVGDSIGETA